MLTTIFIIYSIIHVAERHLEVLQKAPTPEPRKLTTSELKRIHEQEESTLRELRLFLRDVINKLGRDRKFAIFAKPVDIEDVRLFLISFRKLEFIFETELKLLRVQLFKHGCFNNSSPNV